MKTNQRSSFGAWVATLPLALGMPVVIWILFWGFDKARGQGMGATLGMDLLVLGVMTFTHCLAYLITGFPIFLSRFGRPDSRIWMPSVGIPLGAISGIIMICVTIVFIEGNVGALHDWSLYAMGAVYGTASAISALIQRPTRE